MAAPSLPSSPRVVLVTGASSGIGLACAMRLAAQGHRVYGASRRIEPHGSFSTLKMDVDSDDSVAQAVGELLAREGRIDAVVHCAGYVLTGAVEETSIEEAKAQFETNF